MEYLIEEYVIEIPEYHEIHGISPYKVIWTFQINLN